MAPPLKHRWRRVRRKIRHTVHDIRYFTHPAVKYAVVGALALATVGVVVYAIFAA